MDSICIVDGCSSPRFRRKHGFCSYHYNRYFHGHLDMPNQHGEYRPMCSITGCSSRVGTRGMCMTHAHADKVANGWVRVREYQGLRPRRGAITPCPYPDCPRDTTPTTDYCDGHAREYVCVRCAQPFRAQRTGAKRLPRYCSVSCRDESYRESGMPWLAGTQGSVSRPELEVAAFIESLGYEVEHNDRRTLAGKELDILLPALRVAVEFQGDYWHAEDRLKEGSPFVKHLHKVQGCEAKGIRLAFVWESDWKKRRPEVEAALVHLFTTGECSPILADTMRCILPCCKG